MLETVLDISLLLVSGSACLYCIVLSRRLRALQDMKKGLGASIVSLSEAISKTSVAAQEARVSAAQSAEKLSRLLSEIDRSVPVVDELIESINRSTRKAANETTRMQDDAVATVRPILDEAKKTAAELAGVLELINQRTQKLQEQARSHAETSEEIDRSNEALLSEIGSLRMNFSIDAEDGPVLQTGDNGKPNPFAVHMERLRAVARAHPHSEGHSETHGAGGDETTPDSPSSDRSAAKRRA